MKLTLNSILFFVSLSMMMMMATQCGTSASTAEETLHDYYFSIDKNNHKGTNPNLIAGWTEKSDLDKQYLEEFQETIAEIFELHQGLKEVKIVSSVPGSTGSETTVSIELICNDGYVETVTHQLIKEGEVWKVSN